MSAEIFFFILAAIIAFMPTFWDMKVKDENLNWWTRLTLAGKIYIIAFGTFFGTGLYLTVRNHNESITKEAKANERIKSDSVFMSNLTIKVNRLIVSDSSYRSAIKKAGFRYDSLNAIIFSPIIYRKEETKNMFQNYGTNFGNQAGRDINIVNARKLSSEELNRLVEDIEKVVFQYNVGCVNVLFEVRSNATVVYNQLINALELKGLRPISGTVQLSFIEEGITYRIEDNCMKIFVGYFK